MASIQDIAAAVEAGKAKDVKALVQQAIDNGTKPEDILNGGMIQAMSNVGERFKNNEIFVPEMLVAARAMKAGVGVLKPYLVDADIKPIGKVIIGTVAGDLHDIGKNLVGMMIEGAGFDVIDLGVDVPADKFVQAALDNQDATIVGLSALLTTTMPAMRDTVSALKSAGLATRVKVMIGGAPVTDEFRNEIGADGYSEDAASAAELAKKLSGVA